MNNYSSGRYSLEECKEEFIEILRGTEREGIDDLLKYLEKTDFYRAPASLNGHECREGGLLRHCLNVYTRMSVNFANEYKFREFAEFEKKGVDFGKLNDSIAIVSLLHEICNANYFKPVMSEICDPQTGELKIDNAIVF